MRQYLKGLVILPVFLIYCGFGPFSFSDSAKTDLSAFTHIDLEGNTYLSKGELDQKIADYQTSVAPRRVSYRVEAAPGIYFVSATAYSSTVDQCDGDPFTTASGQHVRDGIIAANFLPFGTKVRIPDYFGDKVFEVQDRMNKRYTNRVDVWMQTRLEAIQFGVKRNLKIEVL